MYSTFPSRRNNIFAFPRANALIFSLLFLLFLNTAFSFGQEPVATQAQTGKTVKDIGNYAQFVPTVASLALIATKGDKQGFWQFAKSAGTNLALTFILKYTINKPRPNGATDGHAFPSGHTSGAFQGASFLQRRYGWSYGIPAYLVAGFVGYSRLAGNNPRHDGYDVLAGAAIGIGSTYLFTTSYQKEHYELTFAGAEGYYLLGLKYKF